MVVAASGICAGAAGVESYDQRRGRRRPGESDRRRRKEEKRKQGHIRRGVCERHTRFSDDKQLLRMFYFHLLACKLYMEE